jgi:putative pyruvate formate lyase activating enzyme
MNLTAQKDAENRAKRAEKLMEACRLCPRACGVNRLNGERGFCGLTGRVHCYREVLNFREEQELIPSHQIHLAGCNLRCEYCMVMEWNEQPTAAKVLDEDQLTAAIDRRLAQGARTLNILGGEPSVSIHGILRLLARTNPNVRLVWNSNMYFQPIVDEFLDGLVDLYLADFKCGCGECAEKILGSSDYVSVVQASLKRVIDKADVIVRHILLPGHRDCCFKPMLAWIVREIPGVKVSIKGDYIPPPAPCHAPVQYVSEEEYRFALKLAKEMGVNLIS